MRSFEFEVTQSIGVLSSADNGYTKELNLVSWDGRKPRIDIRGWKNGEDSKKPLKGLSMSDEESRRLYLLLKSMYESEGGGTA